MNDWKSKPPFEAAHNCICAFAGQPILDFYKGYFDTVYIILHPFFKGNEWRKPEQLISWQEFNRLAGFKDINQLDVALRSYIYGLTKECRSDQDMETLKRVAEENDLYIPSEGEFQPTLMSQMLQSLQDQGHHYMFIADEHGLERKLEYIADVLEQPYDVKFNLSGHDCWYTNHNEILYTTHWDSFFTLLCSDRKTVESIVDKYQFEGFYCDEQTEIFWSVKGK